MIEGLQYEGYASQCASFRGHSSLNPIPRIFMFLGEGLGDPDNQFCRYFRVISLHADKAQKNQSASSIVCTTKRQGFSPTVFFKNCFRATIGYLQLAPLVVWVILGGRRLVRIYQKSQENSQKRASTDTRIRRVQKEAKESKPKPEKSSPQSNPVNNGQTAVNH
ncbi:hypothetical protein Tco_0078261 [Tanacetum coccineum]